jgi:GntR family transcriptional regulator
MLVEIDFSSDEAIYLQLRDQIVLMIATDSLSKGQVLPSVRQLADEVGINMHTVNKTYSLLRQEGFIKVDRRKGAVVAVDEDRLRARAEVEKELKVILAEAACRSLTRNEIHDMIDRIYDEYGCKN